MALSLARTRRLPAIALGVALVAAATLTSVASPVGAIATSPTAAGPNGVSLAATSGHPTMPITILRVGASHGQTYVPPRIVAGSTTRTSSVRASIVVTYHGFPTQAKAAFQAAVDLWKTLVQTRATVKIDATWKPLTGNQLGGAGPGDYFRDFDGARQGGTWYPEALADTLAGRRLSDQPDIMAEFNSSRSDWYLGTDGQVPANELDFTSVVLHEIGHGLGMFDSTDVAGGKGSYGFGSGLPFMYDRRVLNSAGSPITEYPNNSAGLASALQSGALSWGVPGQAGTKPVLYAPNPFEEGSSVSHLDEATYPAGNANSLMTPFIGHGEAVHDPGDLVLGIFSQLGWQVAGAKSAASAPALTSAIAGDQKVAVAWTPSIDTGRQLITGYRVSSYLPGHTTASATTDFAISARSGVVTGMANGVAYQYAVQTLNQTGPSHSSAKSELIATQPLAPFTYTSHLVRQQFADFLGRAATSSELAAWDTKLHSQALTSSGAVAAIAALPAASSSRGRMTRLYSAYFGRLPDYGGFTYWTGKLDAGTSLGHASDTFAASSEFQTKYGHVSNSAFVDLVYENVLHRSPDAKGKAHWVAKLAAHAMSRGAVMLQFSESHENLTKMAAKVTSVVLRTGMLRRMPTPTEYADDTTFLATHPAADLAATILALPAYAARITA